MIQGYVLFKGRKEPVTWESETKKHVYNVSRLTEENGVYILSRKYFDDKMAKDEIIDYTPLPKKPRKRRTQ